MLSAKEVSHKEPDLNTMIENVAYRSSYLSPIDLEAQTPCEKRVNFEQNVAYESTKVVLSPNVPYESHNNLTPCEGVCLEHITVSQPKSYSHQMLLMNLMIMCIKVLKVTTNMIISNKAVAEDTNDLYTIDLITLIFHSYHT